jgi:hypothetical protein
MPTPSISLTQHLVYSLLPFVRLFPSLMHWQVEHVPPNPESSLVEPFHRFHWPIWHFAFVPSIVVPPIQSLGIWHAKSPFLSTHQRVFAQPSLNTP